MDVPFTPTNQHEIPAAPGAYALLLHLAKPVRLDLKSVPVRSLPGGWHIYLGSARGPGGLRSRIGRHFRRTKKSHWHIDRLTAKADTLSALAVEGGSECDLVRRLLAEDQIRCEAPGFGSSDCTTCPGHLLTIT
ncbi:MAG: GIY-YIG nuclease family protein [Pseudomonadota bacterium]